MTDGKRVLEVPNVDNLVGGTKRVYTVNSIDNTRGGTKRVIVVGGGSSAVIDPLNVTPSTSAQTITASGGVDGYSPVNVSAVDASIDANITAGNIKKDVSILGITGTYEGQTPTGSISITSNGTYDVTDKAEAVVNVPTTAPAHYVEKTVDANGVLQGSTNIINLNGVTDVGDYVLAYAYRGISFTTNTVLSIPLIAMSGDYACQYMFQTSTGLTSANLSALTTISGDSACNSMFQTCVGLTSANLSALTTISGSYACARMFSGCTGLTSANLSALTTISGDSACQYMFSSTGLTSANLPALTTISGQSACNSMFQNCKGLTSVNLPALTTISRGQACAQMFYGCTSLATVYIGGTTAIDFGGKTNVFSSMFSGCTQNIDVYAPAANQAQIEAFSGYPNFGGTGTVTWHWRS